MVKEERAASESEVVARASESSLPKPRSMLG